MLCVVRKHNSTRVTVLTTELGPDGLGFVFACVCFVFISSIKLVEMLYVCGCMSGISMLTKVEQIITAAHRDL